jgi:hypothetical protein
MVVRQVRWRVIGRRVTRLYSRALCYHLYGMDGHSTARRGLVALSHPRRNGMIKLVTRERMCGLFRGQEEEHRDIHEDLFGQLAQ